MRWLREVSTPAAVLLVLVGARPGAAQYLGGGDKSPREVQLADLEELRDKFVALGGAFSEEDLDWRPMAGVRSGREVLALVATEASHFPTMWGFALPVGSAEDFTAELNRLQALTRDELLRNLEASLDHTIRLADGLDPPERSRLVDFFGLTTPLEAAVTLMGNDLHEHLGQLIAYARMNRIVPPWSR